MKKILLVNPYIYDFAAYDLWQKPIGLMCLSDFLKSAGFDVEFIDVLDRNYSGLNRNFKKKPDGTGKYTHEIVDKPFALKAIKKNYRRYGWPVDFFRNELQKISKPDFILVTSFMTYWYPGLFFTIKILKEIFPESKIIIGGIYVNLCYEHAVKNSGADFIINNNDMNKFYNIIGINNEFNIINTSPDFDLYKKIDYGIIFTSTGCSRNCTYCASKKLFPKVSYKTNENVIKEFEYFYQREIKNMAFYDDDLLYKADDRFIPLMKQLYKRRFSFNFYTPNGLNIRSINEEISELLYKLNFIKPRLSLESSDEIFLSDTGEKVTISDFQKAVINLRNAGYKSEEIDVYIMAGRPGQKYKSVLESIKFVKDIGITPKIVEYSLIPCTSDWQKFIKIKKYEPVIEEPLLHNNSIFCTHFKVLSEDELQNLKDYARE